MQRYNEVLYELTRARLQHSVYLDLRRQISIKQPLFFIRGRKIESTRKDVQAHFLNFTDMLVIFFLFFHLLTMLKNNIVRCKNDGERENIF